MATFTCPQCGALESDDVLYVETGSYARAYPVLEDGNGGHFADFQGVTTDYYSDEEYLQCRTCLSYVDSDEDIVVD